MNLAKKKGFELADEEKFALEVKGEHLAAVKAIFVPRIYRAPKEMQYRIQWMEEHTLALKAKLCKNRFPDIPDAYLIPVKLTKQGKVNIAKLGKAYIEDFWNDRGNWTQFTSKQQFEQQAAGLYDETEVNANTDMKWPLASVKQQFPGSIHEDIYYLVIGGNHGIAAVKMFLEEKGRDAWHPNLLFRNSKLYINVSDKLAVKIGKLSSDAAENVWGTDVYVKVTQI